jgi:hypothetical protein
MKDLNSAELEILKTGTNVRFGHVFMSTFLNSVPPKTEIVSIGHTLVQFMRTAHLISIMTIHYAIQQPT